MKTKRNKRILSLVLFLAVMVGTMISCGREEQEPDISVTGSYLASFTGSVTVDGTEKQTVAYLLLNCISDGSAELYVSSLTDGVYGGAHYTGSWQAGENSEGDDILSFTYAYGESEGQTATVTDAVLLDGAFSAKDLYVSDTVPSAALTFYEMAPAVLEGTSYIGYLSKSVSMGTFVYGYVVNLKDDGTFTASVLQNTPFGAAIKGQENGTYTLSGTEITLVYDVLDDADGDGLVESVLEGGEGYTSSLTDYSETGFTGGIYIGQVSMAVSPAQFIRITK